MPWNPIEDSVNVVKQAVWLAAAILTRNCWEEPNCPDEQGCTLEQFAFQQAEIVIVAQLLVRERRVFQAMTAQHYNGDNDNNTTNYLRQVGEGPNRRLTAIGEFGDYREIPEFTENELNAVVCRDNEDQDITIRVIKSFVEGVYTTFVNQQGGQVQPRQDLGEGEEINLNEGPANQIRREVDLQNFLNDLLNRALPEYTCTQEEALTYNITNGHNLDHRSDILIQNGDIKKYVSIEIKHRSSVTDAFKARCYDAFHLKREYGNRILCVLVYVRAPGTGLVEESARRICYIFDYFFFLQLAEIENENMWTPLIRKIGSFFEERD